MKCYLMHPARDFDARPPSSKSLAADAQDLELGVLLNAAAGKDRYLRDIMQAALGGAWANDLDTIRYRQGIIKDCLTNPDTVRQLYKLATEPFGRDAAWHFSLYGNDPGSKVSSATQMLRHSLALLKRLRDTCRADAATFKSRGFRQFFKTIEQNLDDAYLRAAAADLDRLAFRRGVLLSAQLGDGGKGINTKLRVPTPRDLSWIRRLLTPGPKSFTFQLHPRDMPGAQAFGELKNRGLGQISDALWQSAQHVLSFFRSLRAELAFYVACVNLHEQLRLFGETITYPKVTEEPGRFECRNLRDACLSLTMGRKVIGNDVNANGQSLVVITGANRGGKSTFLRSAGVAQLMSQCGLFVTADFFSSSLRTGLFTHYKRDEDRTMQSGKFDEELARMSTIADQIHRGALMLFNESFSATNEREGSETARQIVTALLEGGVTVFFVSHMHEFAQAFLDDERTLFLRAPRDDDGARSFRLIEGKPQSKSFGIDLYHRIFAVSGSVK